MFEFTMADLANRVRQEAARQGIDPETAVAALIAENTADGKFDPDRKISTKTTSHRGAIGALQVMPGTFEALKKQGFVAAHHTLDNIEGQIAGGVAALKEIQTRTKDSRPLRLLAEYNGGPKAGAAFASGNFDALHPETQGYLSKGKMALGMTDGAMPGSFADASGIESLIKNYDKVAANTQDLLAGIIGGAEKDSFAAKSAIDSSVKAGVSAIGAKTKMDNAEEENKLRQVSFFGASTRQADSAIAKATAEYATAEQALARMTPEVQALQNIDPISDPLGWITAQFKMIGTAQRWNAVAQQKDRAAQTIATVQQQTAAQQSIEPALQAQTRNELAAAESSRLTAQAAIAKLEVDEKLRSARINTLLLDERFAGNRVSHAMQMARLKQDQEQFSFAKGEKGKEEQRVTRWNDYLKLHGHKPVVSMADLKIYGGETEAAMAEAITSGGGIGGTLGQSVRMTYLMRSLPKIKQDMPLAGAFIERMGIEARADIQKMRLEPGNQKLTESQLIEKAVNGRWDKYRKQLETSDHASLDDKNPLKMETFVAASNPALAENTFAKFVISQKANTGVAPKEQQVLEQAIGQITAGQPKEKVMQELSAFFREGYKYQLDSLGLGILGADITDPKNKDKSTGYRINSRTVSRVNALADSNVEVKDMNVLNPVELENLLTQMRARQVQQAAIDKTTPGFPSMFDLRTDAQKAAGMGNKQ